MLDNFVKLECDDCKHIQFESIDQYPDEFYPVCEICGGELIDVTNR